MCTTTQFLIVELGFERTRVIVLQLEILFKTAQMILMKTMIRLQDTTLLRHMLHDGAFGTTHSTGTTDSATANKLSTPEQLSSQTVCKLAQLWKTLPTPNIPMSQQLDSETQLSVNDDIFVSGENYRVYTNKYGSVTFENEGSDDFRLDQTDTLAINQGADLSADADLAFTHRYRR